MLFFCYLILSDPGRSNGHLSRVWILAMMVTINTGGRVGVAGVTIELHVLHAVVVLDKLLHIDITKVSGDLGPLLVLVTGVCSGVTRVRMTMSRVLPCLLPWLLLGSQCSLQH